MNDFEKLGIIEVLRMKSMAMMHLLKRSKDDLSADLQDLLDRKSEIESLKNRLFGGD